MLFLMVSLYPNFHLLPFFSTALVDRFETVNGTMGMSVGGGVEVGVGIDVGLEIGVGVVIGAKVGGVAVGRAAMVASTAAAIVAWVSTVGVVGTREGASMIGGGGVVVIGDELAQAVDASAKSTNTPDTIDLFGCTSASSIKLLPVT